MKAILKNDLIIKLSIDRGVEIGNIPSGVSLERLRWDGSTLIDLAVPGTRYVKHLGDNYFELHVIELDYTQSVYMQYSQRRDLRYSEITGTVFLASDVVKADEQVDIDIQLIKARLKKYIGDETDLFMKHFALTAALIVFASKQPPALKTFFDSISDDIIQSFPLNRWEQILKSFSKEIKKYLNSYYDALDRKQ
jgi:hypothetical protein